jgi:hypothetical protein
MSRLSSSRFSFKFQRRLLMAASLLFALLAAASSPAFPSTVPCATINGGLPEPFNSTNPGDTYFCTITTTVNPDGSEDVLINQPVVDRTSFEYKSITFNANDLVTVTADGCVQTAGIGSTWKRYVNPSGSDSGPPSGLYFGSIWIHGGITKGGETMPGTVSLLDLPTAVVPFSPQPTGQIFVPSNADLILAYVDDNYTDHGGNGYWQHDDGNNGQCADTDPNAPLGSFGGPARVKLHIVHNAANPFPKFVAKQFDLVPNGTDQNGFYLNPEWGWQVNGGSISSQGDWDASCLPGCSSQNPSFDSSTITSTNWFDHIFFDVCDMGFLIPGVPYPGPVGSFGTGHHNWFDVTYTGQVFWVEHSSSFTGDDDYNMRVLTHPVVVDPQTQLGFGAGTSAGNANGENKAAEQDIGLEFDSDETIDHFDQNVGWQGLHDVVDGGDDEITDDFLNGHDAVIVGLMGFDEMHGTHSEIHPVHALAIRDPGAPRLDPASDRWLFFVRNWGDEGECSHLQHYLPATQITLQIPPPVLSGPNPPKFTLASLNPDTQVLGTGTDGQFSFSSGSDGTFVTFDLPDGSLKAFAFGELDLNWNPSSGSHRASPAQSPRQAAPGRAPLRVLTAPVAAEDKEGGEAEKRLATIWTSLTPGQQQLDRNLVAVLYPLKPPIVSTPLAVHIVASPPQRPTHAPGVEVALATEKLQRDMARLQALCAATAGQIPTQPAWCPESNVPPVTTVSTSGGAPIVKGCDCGPVVPSPPSPLIASLSMTGPPAGNGWDTTPVTATLTGYDANGSGLAVTQYSYDRQTWIRYAGPFILPDGVYNLYYRSEDKRGNVEETRQQSFKIDTRPPVLSITQPAAMNYTHNSNLTLNYGADDGAASGLGQGSGLQSLTPVLDGATSLAGHGLASGQAIYLLAEMSVGPHTFSLHAVDNVGHAGSQSVIFNIIATPESLFDEVNQFVAAGKIGQDLGRSLLAKLQAANKVRGTRNCPAAGKAYAEFAEDVNEPGGKLIDPTATAILAADAQYLIAHCP